MHPDKCPECGINWYSDETIYEHFLGVFEGNEEEARRIADTYGDGDHFGENVIGIEIQGEYDGISYWRCEGCGLTFDRFTMKLVEDDI
jgi:hypothetical protein